MVFEKILLFSMIRSPCKVAKASKSAIRYSSGAELTKRDMPAPSTATPGKDAAWSQVLSRFYYKFTVVKLEPTSRNQDKQERDL